MNSKTKVRFKSLLSVLLVLAMLFSNAQLFNSIAMASEPNEDAQESKIKIIFDKSVVGKGIDTVEFDSMDEVLGMQGAPGDVGGWIFKQYFVGWSDNKNFLTEKTGEFYFSNQLVSDVYSDGYDPENPKTLYAIYVDNGALSTGMNASKIYINKELSDQETLLDTVIYQSTGFDSNDLDKEVIGVYDEDKDSYRLDLSANFQMDPSLALLTYFNPGGILTNSGQWDDGPIQGAWYSHIDLHIKLDDRIVLAEELKDITFKSYNFKPSFILTKDYEIIKGGLSSLVTQGNPETTFSFEPGDNKEFILRATIRRDGNSLNALNATPDQVFSDMTLTSGNKDNFTISKEVAEELAETGEKLLFNGYIDGNGRAAEINLEIPRIDSKELRVGFQIVKPNVQLTVHTLIDGVSGMATKDLLDLMNPKLIDDNGNEFIPEKIQDNGHTFEFESLPKGKYKLVFDYPEGYKFAPGQTVDGEEFRDTEYVFELKEDTNLHTQLEKNKPAPDPDPQPPKPPKPNPGTPSKPKPTPEKPKKATAILANGSKYTDVLTATVLANERSCPILLTEKDNLTEETLNELHRRGIGDVIISGGVNSVSEKVVEQLKEFNVVRISGADRYETAREIGKAVRELTGKHDGAVLVDGTNFPDVITISALASQRRVPILITQPAALNPVTEATIKEWKLSQVTIGGQTNSVSEAVENRVDALVANVDRIGGVDRYETASLIGAEVRKNSTNKTDMILVDGTNFPDGITVNSLAAKHGCPIHLTNPNTLTSITKEDIEKWEIKNILVVGGLNSVSEDIYNSLNVNKERLAGENRYSTAVKISQRLDNAGLLSR